MIQKSFNDGDVGKLYLVPTPIGNLQDMTFRAVDILRDADYILAEDTRNTQKLLNHFEIDTKTKSFHEHNSREKLPAILKDLKSGLTIAQVSDAGMPLVSDPGDDIVSASIAEKIPVIAVPGASAGVTGLIASGLPVQPFMFYGFLPRTSGHQRKVLTQFESSNYTSIFYESPFRIKKTLGNFLQVFGEEREVVLARELTKKFEEYFRGNIKEAISWYDDHEPKGEFVLMLAPRTNEESIILSNQDLKQLVSEEISAGLNPNDAIKKVAKTNKLPKKVVYNSFHDLEG